MRLNEQTIFWQMFNLHLPAKMSTVYHVNSSIHKAKAISRWYLGDKKVTSVQIFYVHRHSAHLS